MGNMLTEGGCGAAVEARAPRQLTVTERLKNEKERLEIRLKEVDDAIEALESSPEVQLAVDAVSKLGHF